MRAVIEHTAPNLSGVKIKDRYVLLEEIGCGLMARAYLAYDELLEGEVVVKVLNTEIGGVGLPLGPDWVQEAKRAMKVRGCPFIASVTDFGEEVCEVNGEKQIVPFIVWERVHGRTLMEYIDENRQIDTRMIIETTLQLLQVLIALKHNDLVHGDLHLKNVMYDNVSASRHFVKVIDFGLAIRQRAEVDFKRDRLSVGKVIGQLIDAYRSQNIEKNSQFTTEIERLTNDISSANSTTLANLTDLLARAEEMERKFVLGFEWFQTRRKRKPAGLEPSSYLSTQNGEDSSLVASVGGFDGIYQWLKGGLESGVGRILAIKGDTGLGKSSWSLELVRSLLTANLGVHVMYSGAYPGDAGRPMEPIRRIWRTFLGEGESENYREFLTQMFPEIPLLVDPLVEFLEPVPMNYSEKLLASDDAHLLKLIATALKHIALKHGLVFCIDDFNNVDEHTLGLVGELAMAASRYPLLLIITFSSLAGAKVGKLIGELGYRDNFKLHELRELSRDESRQFVVNRYKWGNNDDAIKLGDLLYSQVGGNPRFLSEMLKFLENRNFIINMEKGTCLDSRIEVSENPQSIQSLMLERVVALPEPSYEMVKWASILGSNFNIEHLASLTGASPTEMNRLTSSLIDEHRIWVRRGEVYSFNPLKLSEVVYAGIPDDEKSAKHLTIAEFLRERVQLDPKLNALVAYHLVKANRKDQAPAYFLKAAQFAFRRNLKSQAEEWSGAGIQILESMTEPDDALLGQFYLLKGQAARQIGDGKAYKENVFMAYNCAIVNRDRKLEGTALKALGEYYRSLADYATSVDYYKNGLDVFHSLNDPREVALILKELSTNYCFMGNFEKAIEELEQSREISEEIDDREGMARIYNNLGLIYKILGNTSLAKEWLDRSIHLFREIGDINGEVLPIGNMAIIYTEEGEYERAMILLRDITSSEERISDMRIKAKVHLTIGDALFELGEFEETLEYYERALMVFRAVGDRQGECETLTNLAFLYLELDKTTLAENYSRLALEIKKDIGYERGIAYNRLIEARIALRAGKVDLCRNALDAGLKSFESFKNPQLKVRFLYEDFELARTTGNIREARKRLDLLDNLVKSSDSKISPAFLMLYYHKRGIFLNEYYKLENGDDDIKRSKDLLNSLERKILNKQWREKFKRKYEHLLNAV